MKIGHHSFLLLQLPILLYLKEIMYLLQGHWIPEVMNPMRSDIHLLSDHLFTSIGEHIVLWIRQRAVGKLQNAQAKRVGRQGVLL